LVDQCQHIQRDIRSLLTRLQPFGPATSAQGAGPEAEPLARLHALLQALVTAWAAPGRDGVAVVTLEWRWQDPDAPDGAAQQAPADAVPDLALPRALALALYRISQEALTNVARHAQAGQARLSLHFAGARQAGAMLAIDWCVQDDGVGLASADAKARGNGIAGLRLQATLQARLLPP
jgi:two-component system sensor histidine kinase UhpB